MSEQHKINGSEDDVGVKTDGGEKRSEPTELPSRILVADDNAESRDRVFRILNE